MVRGDGEHRIRSLRSTEIRDLTRQARYYRSRREYLETACRITDDLIQRFDLRTALELGPHLRPIVVGADVMDNKAKSALEHEGRVVIHNARRTPWPFEDARYDLFVGLQVFEHLGRKQAEAFAEVRRVARHAVLSLPIDWEMEDPTDCHHRISHERALSWFAPTVPSDVVVGNEGPRKRLIYVFETLGADS